MEEIQSNYCLMCDRKTVNGWIYCANCTPTHKQKRTIKNKEIFVGYNSYLLWILNYFKGKKNIKWWMGTDALTLVEFPPGKFSWKVKIVFKRILMKIFDRLIFEHWVVHKNLGKHLFDFGINPQKIKIAVHPPKHQKKFRKIKHDGINILYFCRGHRSNNKFKRWKYGEDLFEQVKAQVDGVNWIVIKGTKGNEDISEYIPLTDAYIRPSRHDGLPRLLLICELNDIPVYYREDFKPEVAEVVEFIENVKKSHL